MNIVIPMAGDDASFRQAGFAFIKSLVEVQGKPLIQHVYESLSALHQGQFIFVIRNEDAQRFHLDKVLHLMAPGSRVLKVEAVTAGAACSALMAIEFINNDEELVVTNGDHLLHVDLKASLEDFRALEWDGATLVFESVHPRWSYVRVNNDNMVVEAAEKNPISRLATAGFYYFRRGQDFIHGCMEMIRKGAHVEHQYYVCPVFNEMLLNDKKIGIRRIRQASYISLATPQGVERYEERLAREGSSDAI